MKVDRLISMKLKGPEKTTVPRGEMWKATAYGQNFDINGTSPNRDGELIAVGGDVIGMSNGNVASNLEKYIQFSGIAFTI